MEVNGVGSQGTNKTAVKRDIADMDVFLKILTVQLSNQDPMNAKDNTEYIAQMAQFAALEQSKNQNVNLEKLVLSQRLTEGTLMIGQEVQFKNNDDTISKEIVKGVKVFKNSVYLTTANGDYKIDNIIGVGETEIDK